MDKFQIIIIADALLYLVSLIYWGVKLKKINAGIIILFIMTISHIGAIFYYTILDDLGLIVGDIEIMPFVYLYLMIIIGLLPFLNHEGIKKIDSNGNANLIKFFAIFIIIISIEPFIENLYVFLFSNSDYAEAYEDMREGELNIYSSIGKRLMRWSNYFRLFVPIAFFYFLSKSKKKWKIICGLGLCMINHIMFWVNEGGRGGILSQFMMYFLCFVLCVPIFSQNTIRKMRNAFLVVLIPVIVLFAAMTISRYSAKDNPNKSLMGWVLLYSSEGPIKFNNEMWSGEHNTNGDVNLNFLKDLLGMKTYTTFEERDDYYLAKNGRRIEVFYTYVGDFVSDFGIWGGIIACLILYYLTCFFLKKDGGIPFQNMLFILYIIHLYSIGFASNIYRSYSMQKGNFYVFIIFILLSLAYKPKIHIAK